MQTIIILSILSIGLQLTSANLDAALQSYLQAISTRTLVGKQSDVVQNLYTLYKTEYNRNSKTTDDDKLRFASFNKTLNAISDNYRQASKTHTLGLNQFADWTEDELRVLNSGLQVPQDNMNQTNTSSTGRLLPWNPTGGQSRATLPASYDLTNMVVSGTSVPVILPVKNQLQCGSCYAFAFINLLEFQYAIQLKKSTTLSEQQLVDCSRSDYGCNGGYFYNTFSYLQTNKYNVNGGLYYPYRAVAGQCAFKSSGNGGVIFGTLAYQEVTPNNAPAIQTALVTYGPVWVSLFVGNQTSKYQSIFDTFSLYKSGVLRPTGCLTSVSSTNHAVVIVGYGVDTSTGIAYWKVRNSWGSGWGESGYFKIQRGVNMCGIESGPFIIGKAA